MISVRGMQAADGPNSSQLEWHQDGGKTMARIPLSSSDIKTAVKTTGLQLVLRLIDGLGFT